MRILLVLLMSGCTFNLTIETEYAAQSGSGTIEETAESKDATVNTTDVSAEVEEGL